VPTFDTAAPSIHVYSPPLASMNHYEPEDDSPLRVIHRELVAVDTFASE